MSVNTSNSKSLIQCEIKSKYFTERHVMDESLSDFQEKKNFTGPKKTDIATSKKKPKKTIKRIKGQKDIRSALKSKKNELVAYANDFDKVCKQSGIDVDSEQLQLAIALSKSLQQSEGVLESNDSQNSGSLTSQERTGTIRTTLLEYGFKVPEIKITATKSRRLKSYRKNYKLLSASGVEKKQIISDRYTQVLFQNIKHIAVKSCSINKISESKIRLYHIATDISYKTLKNIDTFYVKDLIELNHTTAGSLLKDWSEIPGRPATPQVELQNIKFYDIDCSQEEFDVILAGTLQSAQEIVKEKYKLIEKNMVKEGKVNLETDVAIYTTNNTISCDVSNETDGTMKTTENQTNYPVILETKSPRALSVTSQVRSCSPDIFDDEVCSIIDTSKEDSEGLFQVNLCKDITKRISNVMDLTECVNFLSEQSLNTCKSTIKNNSRMLLNLSQEENISKTKSVDFMEITECVATYSQPVTNKEIHKVDLSQNLVQCSTFQNKKIEKVDLTQSSDSNDSLPFVQISGKDKTLDDTIILTEVANLEVIDLKSGISRDNKLFNKNDDKPESCATDNVLQNSNSLLDCNNGEKSLIVIDSDGEANKDSKKQNKNENQRGSNTSNIAKESVGSKCESFYEEFNHPHSESSKEQSEDGVLSFNESLNNSVESECFNKQNNNDNIDLTQSSDSSIEKEGTGTVRSKEQLEAKSFSGIHKSNVVSDCVTNDKIMRNDINLTQNSESLVGTLLEARDIVGDEKPLEVEVSLSERHDISGGNENNSLLNDIDLTQNSDSFTEKIESVNSNNTATRDNRAVTKVSDTKTLGKIGDVSIDYDEIFDDMIASHTNQNKSYKSEIYASKTNDSTEKSRTHSISNSSKNSDIFEISDNELNYSVNQSRHEIAKTNFDIGGLSIMDDLSEPSGSKLSTDVDNSTKARVSVNESFLPEVNLGGTNYNKANNFAESKASPFRNILNEQTICTKTPTNSDYIIKTDQVTPMMDYESLTTPERNRELDKHGLKPFKRKRAIQLLTHLYNQTHPIVESYSMEDFPSPSKKQKMDNNQISNTQVHISPKKHIKSPAKYKGLYKSPTKSCESLSTQDGDVLDKINNENNDVYRVTNEAPEIKNIECSEDDWMFQKREKAKVHSCRVPLHIAFHNYVSCRQRLREAILRYEPVNIDVIHKGLVDSGHKYDAKELLKFMDKKCITVKTADNSVKNNRKHY